MANPTVIETLEEMMQRQRADSADAIIVELFPESITAKIVGSEEVVTGIAIPAHIDKTRLVRGQAIRLGLHQGQRILLAVLDNYDEDANYSGLGYPIPHPPNVVAVARADGWHVSWLAVANAVGYRLYRNDDPTETTPDEVGDFTASELSAVIPFEGDYTWFAVKSLGVTTDSELSAWGTDGASPLNPAWVSHEYQAGGHLVRWSHPDSNDVKEFVIYRNTSGVDAGAVEVIRTRDLNTLVGYSAAGDYFGVQAVDYAGNRSVIIWTTIAYILTPNPPTNATGGITANGFIINWLAPVTNPSAVVEYRVYSDDNGDGTSKTLRWRGNATQSGTIAYGTDEYFFVCAVGYDGSESTYAATGQIDPTPGTPIAMAQMVELGGYVVNWEFVLNVTGYEVYTATDASGSREKLAWVGNALQTGVLKESGFNYFRVRAIGYDGSTGAWTAWLTDSNPPPQPAIAVIGGTDTVTVSLAAGDASHTATGFSHYKLERADDAGGTNATTLDATALYGSFPRVLSQALGTTKYYRLTPYDLAGNAGTPTAWTAGVTSSSTGLDTTVPTSLTVVAVGSGFNVSWTPGANADWFDLRLASDNAGSGATVVWSGAASSVFIPFDTAAGMKYFSVRARGTSNVWTAYTAWATDSTAPPTPAGFSTHDGIQQVYLKVDPSLDTSQYAAGFRYWEAQVADDASGTNAATVGTLTPAGLPVVTPQTANTTKYYRIRAVDWAGNTSGWTSWVSARSLLTGESTVSDDFYAHSIYQQIESFDTASQWTADNTFIPACKTVVTGNTTTYAEGAAGVTLTPAADATDLWYSIAYKTYSTPLNLQQYFASYPYISFWAYKGATTRNYEVYLEFYTGAYNRTSGSFFRVFPDAHDYTAGWFNSSVKYDSAEIYTQGSPSWSQINTIALVVDRGILGVDRIPVTFDDLRLVPEAYYLRASGTATDAYSDIIIDANQSYPEQEFNGDLLKLVAGTGSGQQSTVYQNYTSGGLSAISTRASFSTSPAAGTGYEVWSMDWPLGTKWAVTGGRWVVYKGGKTGEISAPYSLGQLDLDNPTLYHTAYLPLETYNILTGTVQAGIMLKTDGVAGLDFFVKDIAPATRQCYSVEVDVTNDTITLVKWVAGTRTVISSASFTLALNQTLWVAVDLRDFSSTSTPGKLRVYASLTEAGVIATANRKIEVTDTSLAAGGSVGLFSKGAVTKFAKFKAGSPAHADYADDAGSLRGPVVGANGSRVFLALIEKNSVPGVQASADGTTFFDVPVLAAVGATPSANLAISASTLTTVRLNTQLSDSRTFGNWSDYFTFNTSTYRFTATKAGVVEIVGQVNLYNSSSSARQPAEAGIYKNGTAVAYGAHPTIDVTKNGIIPLTAKISVAAGDYIEVKAYSTASTITIYAANTLLQVSYLGGVS